MINSPCHMLQKKISKELWRPLSVVEEITHSSSQINHFQDHYFSLWKRTGICLEKYIVYSGYPWSMNIEFDDQNSVYVCTINFIFPSEFKYQNVALMSLFWTLEVRHSAITLRQQPKIGQVLLRVIYMCKSHASVQLETVVDARFIRTKRKLKSKYILQQ